ncbi:MAG: hypothetical protein P3W93_004270 [Thermus sp.]|nr:hypothetical protein [Thermus sp.]
MYPRFENRGIIAPPHPLLSLKDLEAIRVLLASRPEWRGTLEDASVVLLALRSKAPVWTLNYRDLGVFRELSFWAG